MFVATVTAGPGGETGGMVVEASTLYRSSLADAVELELLSEERAVVPHPSLARRIGRAARRLVRFLVRLRTVDAVLVFASDTVSLVDKGAMCILARFARRGVVLRLGGGNLVTQCDHNPFARYWLRAVLHQVHVLCTQSAYWTSYFENYREVQGKTVEVANGIVIGTSPDLSRRPSRGRLVFVGWVTREKGLFEALEVLACVRRHHPSATLTVVGGGRDLEAFRDHVRDRDLTEAVRLCGWLDGHQVRRILRDSDVFLFPSHFEGLPNAVIEAMAAGLPVIATRVGGVPDLIRHGENGFLVDVGDVDTMTAHVTDLLQHPERAKAIGARSRQTAVELCDIERVWPHFEEAIRRAAARVGRAAE